MSNITNKDFIAGLPRPALEKAVNLYGEFVTKMQEIGFESLLLSASYIEDEEGGRPSIVLHGGCDCEACMSSVYGSVQKHIQANER